MKRMNFPHRKLQRKIEAVRRQIKHLTTKACPKLSRKDAVNQALSTHNNGFFLKEVNNYD